MLQAAAICMTVCSLVLQPCEVTAGAVQLTMKTHPVAGGESKTRRSHAAAHALVQSTNRLPVRPTAPFPMLRETRPALHLRRHL
ncbi:hypothetical protein [Dactylosporangium sp. CA-092794]|uniref:hypothetical protein n=1 Tax=Dactylosporangium sp. CA-092794 TaxID=3239929 RepID=UPI003D8C6562